MSVSLNKIKSRTVGIYDPFIIDKLNSKNLQSILFHKYLQLHIDSHEQLSPVPQGAQETDFFEEHSNGDNIPRNSSQISMSDDMYMGKQPEDAEEGTLMTEFFILYLTRILYVVGPSVDGLTDETKTQSAEPRKATIGQKKPPKKS